MSEGIQAPYKLVLEVIYTQKQAYELAHMLDELMRDAFTTTSHIEQIIAEKFPYDLKESFITQVKQNNINLSDPMQFKSYAMKLKGVLETLPVVKMALAFEPTEKNLRAISDWFMAELNKKYLFDIEVRKEIIGGVTIISGGVERDYSIRSKIELLRQQNKFLDILGEIG